MILFVDFDRVSYPSTKQMSFHERASWMPSWSSTLRSRSASRQAGGRYSRCRRCVRNALPRFRVSILLPAATL